MPAKPAARIVKLAAAPMPAESQSKPSSVAWTLPWYSVMGFGLVGHVGGAGSCEAYSVRGFGLVGHVGGAWRCDVMRCETFGLPATSGRAPVGEVTGSCAA